MRIPATKLSVFSQTTSVLLFAIALGCSTSDTPHHVILSNVSDNYGTTIGLTYNSTNQITSIKKTYSSKTETFLLTHQGDSAVVDDGTQITVVKYQSAAPIKEYSYLKIKADSLFAVTRFKVTNGVPTAGVFISRDPSQPDSTVVRYTWTAGNLAQIGYKDYKYGGVSSERILNCTYDQGNNFSNGDYLFKWVLGFEGALFSMCKNNLVSTSYSDNSLTICCYQFQYNSNRYPSAIKGVQLDTYSLTYQNPH